jgi:hypothetical protein
MKPSLSVTSLLTLHKPVCNLGCKCSETILATCYSIVNQARQRKENLFPTLIGSKSVQKDARQFTVLFCVAKNTVADTKQYPHYFGW